MLPETGTSLQVGTLHQQLEGILAAGTGGTPVEPGWTFTPSITAQERWTNQLQTGNPQGGGGFITDIRPAMLVIGNTSRFSGSLNYAPDLRLIPAACRTRSART